MRWIVVYGFLFGLTGSIYGQIDSTNLSDSATVKNIPEPIVKKRKPGKAALYSLIPGGGQVYNRKYWKIPIIYGGLILVGSWVVNNQNLYQQYREEAINRYNNDTIINFPDLSNNDILLQMENYEYKRNLNIVVLIAVYALNIVDATVDAYFFSYDINENLSFRASPFLRPPERYATFLPTAGVTFTLNL